MTQEQFDDSEDCDPSETQDWLDSLTAMIATVGKSRAKFILHRLQSHARYLGATTPSPPYSAYQNTIALEDQQVHPGDVALEERITAINRWNALAMVVRANMAYGELGGHIASYASAAEIFEVGFNHFFKGGDRGQADLVYFQPHSAPGIYARAFLEGRLTEGQLASFRRETGESGLSSYPHPWLMPQFWQFPTGSMGIGPLSCIYQAHVMRYMEHRGLIEPTGRRIWGIFGDGEMDEPESVGALSLAARERLDNLVFIINCNLQRLDGPVRGNGQIIQELESIFAGAGWNVVKVLWGSDWDPLFARDADHALLRRFAATVDGEYQTLGANDGAYNEKRFFQLDPQLRALVAHMSHKEIDALRRGGHDIRKLYAAYASACAHKGQPTVILAKTKKGYGMGLAGESRMTSHQEKKLDLHALRAFRDRFELPLSDQDVTGLKFYKPPSDGPEIKYIKERRTELGGYVPQRHTDSSPVVLPPHDDYARFATELGGKEISTTMCVVRLLSNLLRHKVIGPRIVPIVADEARTFGMANLFKQIGIYSPQGQLYEPEDLGSLLAYREARDGQLLEEGITEAGALSAWAAAATSYSVHGIRTLPFYIFYSMFGFQRVGDLIWAAADQRARGFLIGATAGRTTLGGEGLQHQDGSSHVVAATVPTCRAYDPAFAYEAALIIHHGARQMLERGEDVFYYVTVMNEKYAQPSLAAGAEVGIIRGMHRLGGYGIDGRPPRIRLLGSGAILREVMEAADLLARDWLVPSEVWSVTSFSELARDAREVERWNRLNPGAPRKCSYLDACLPTGTPILAATDYVRAYPQLIASYLRDRFVVLGTDGFGRSDTRGALRRFFEVDRSHIVIAALHSLGNEGAASSELVAAAISKYGISSASDPPWLS